MNIALVVVLNRQFSHQEKSVSDGGCIHDTQGFMRAEKTCRGLNYQPVSMPLVRLEPSICKFPRSGASPRQVFSSFSLPEGAWLKEAKRRDNLLSDAEFSLAWQTPTTYRRWFSCWRRRGVGVNDLLKMTWVWYHRGGA